VSRVHRRNRRRDLAVALLVLMGLAARLLSMSRNRGPGVLGVLAVVAVTALATLVLIRGVTWYQRRLLRALSSRHAYATKCMIPDLDRGQQLALTADPATVQVWHLTRSPDLLMTWRGQPVPITSRQVDIVTRTVPGIVIGEGDEAMEVIAATASLRRWTRPRERDALVDRLYEITAGAAP